MEKLKYVLLGCLLFMALPQAFAIGDNGSYTHVASSGDGVDHFSDCYACGILSPW